MVATFDPTKEEVRRSAIKGTKASARSKTSKAKIAKQARVLHDPVFDQLTVERRELLKRLGALQETLIHEP